MLLDVVTVGNVLIDAFLTLHDANLHCKVNPKDNELCVRLGEKITLDSSEFLLGGNAGNVAVGMKRLGFAAGIVAEIGSDEFAGKIDRGLEEEHVDTTYLKKSEGQSSFALGLQFQGERTLFVNHVIREHDFNLQNLQTKWFYVTSLGKMWRRAYQDVLANAYKNNVQIAFNPGTPQLEDGRESFLDMLQASNILFANKEEAEQIIGIETTTQTLLEDLKLLGAKIVVITDGKKGSMVIDEMGNIFSLGSKPCEMINKTGAGDAYATGFLAAHLLGKGIEDAMRWGNNNAVSVMEKVGAQTGLLTKERMLAEEEVEK